MSAFEKKVRPVLYPVEMEASGKGQEALAYLHEPID
jgi:hypothetical protein